MGPTTFDQCYPGVPLFMPDETGKEYRAYMIEDRRECRLLGIHLRWWDRLVVSGQDSGTPARKVLWRSRFKKYQVVGF